MSRTFFVLAALGFMAIAASANPTAVDWMDRVTHEVQKQEGPLSKRPVDAHLYAGALAFYTSNLLLKPNGETEDDWALMPFVRGRIDYTSSRLELAADLLVNFNAWLDAHAARSDQEHGYGKIRYADGVIDAQLVEIVRHEVDPVDGVFTQYAARVVTDTLARIDLRLGRFLTLYGYGQVETVHFIGSEFDPLENENYRAGLGALGDITDRIKVGLEGGWYRISYRDTSTTPNAEGYYGAAKLRGELTSRLYVEAGLGFTMAHAFHTEPGRNHTAKGSGLDAEVHVRYEVTSTILVEADYTRHFGFAGAGSAFQSLDRAILRAEWEIIRPVTVRIRGQADRVAPSNNDVRYFYYAGIGATWRVVKHLSIDGGFTYRGGNSRRNEDDYDELQGYLGAFVDF